MSYTVICEITVNVFSDLHLIRAVPLETWTDFMGKL